MMDEAQRIEIKERIVDFVKNERPGTSFAEIEDGFPELFGGQYVLEIRKNIILWVNFNEEGIKVIEELFKEKKIFAHPSQLLVYVIDGRALKLPIAKRTIDYKEPHWLPVVLWAHPIEKKKH